MCRNVAMTDTPLMRAVKAAGGQSELARRIGKTQGHVSKWLERDYVPPESVLTLERVTGISRHEWRPDLYPLDAPGFAEEGQGVIVQEARHLPARKRTVAEIEALTQAGVLLEDDRFELIDGKIRPMNAKGIRHEVIKASLNKYWMRRIPDSLILIPETTFRMAKDTFLEPDFVFLDHKTGVAGLNPATALLAVEVADTTYSFDRGEKAVLYARFGVRALWVIEANSLDTLVFAAPGEKGYGERSRVAAEELLAPSFAPELALKLAELPLL